MKDKFIELDGGLGHIRVEDVRLIAIDSTRRKVMVQNPLGVSFIYREFLNEDSAKTGARTLKNELEG